MGMYFRRFCAFLPRWLRSTVGLERRRRRPALATLAAIMLSGCAGLGLMPASARGDSFVEFDFNIYTTDRARSSVFLELFDDRPLTTANFLQYVNGGRYNGSLLHRLALDQSNNPFVLQGGGYYPSYISEPNTPLQESLDPNVTVDLDGNPLTANPTVQNEYNNSPARPNVAGTIAMAKLAGDPNSASNQYFFNLEDNSTTLGSQNNGGYTVFGGVVGDGMLKLINVYAQQLPIVNLNPDTNDDGKPDSGPFDNVPVVFGSNYFLPLALNRAKVVDYLGNSLNTDVPAGGLTFSNKDAFIDTGATFTGAGSLTIGVGRTLGIREGFALNRSLLNHGTLAPGLELGAITVQSSYFQFSDGTLNIEVAGTAPDTNYDQLLLTGANSTAFLAGKLQLSFIAGFTPSLGNSFTVLSAPSIIGNFGSFSLPQLTIPGAVWHENKSSTSIIMSLDYADYNHDGTVNAADYVVWRKMMNQTVTSHTGADGDGDGHITMADFTYWRNHLGDTSGGSHGSGAGSLVNFSVPEPATGLMALSAGLLFAVLPRRRLKLRDAVVGRFFTRRAS